jgi:hypothetical protein
MRRYWFIILLSIACSAQAQFVKNSGLNVINSAKVKVNGDWDNQNSNILNQDTITLSDHWTSTGGYDPNGVGGFVLTNVDDKQFNHSNQQLGFLIKDGTGVTAVDNNLIIKYNLNLINGLLSMTGVNDTLVMLANVQATANSTSYVIGKIARHGTGNLFFPVSRDDHYLPIKIFSVTGPNPVVTISVEDKPIGSAAGTNVSSLTSFPYVWNSTSSGADTATNIEVQYPTSLSVPAADIVARSAPGNTFASMGMSSVSNVGEATVLKSYTHGLKGLFTIAVGPLLPLQAPIASPASAISYTGFTASWEPVVSATGYQIDFSSDNFSTILPGYNNHVVTGTSIYITGLTPLTDYQYRVRATGAAPTSPNSNIIQATTLSAVPIAGSPTSISATGFTANWNAVSGVTGYQLDVSTDNFSTFLAGYNSKSIAGINEAISGLTPQTSYQYRVRTVIAGQPSGNSNTMTVMTGTAGVEPPSAPLAVTATEIALTSFVANWIAVSGATGYQLDVSEDNFATFLTGYNSKSISGISELISGLTANAMLSFRVRAVNAGGTSANSNVISVTTLPNAPVALSASSISASGFSANWNSVPEATGYQLDVSSDNFTTFLSGYNSRSITEVNETLSGLSAQTSYQYRVRYVYATGISGNSNVVSVTTGATGITPPASPIANPASGITLASFVANWVAVSGATGYQLDVSEDNFITFLNGYNSKTVSEISELISGLTANSSFSFRVRAMNAGGTSANSNAIHVSTLLIAPLAISPTGISATGFSANWNSVPGATGYQLDVSSDNFATFLTGYNSKSVTGLTETLTGLTAQTSYQYRVRYVYASGVSGNSNVISATTGTAGTPPPTAPLATSPSGVAFTSFVANWNAAAGATSYQLDVSDNDFTTFITGYNSKSVSGNSAIVSGLDANSTFKFRVRAMNAGGTSGNSNVISVTTLPVAPVAVSATNISAAGFSANWNSVPGATGYQLDVSNDNFTTFISGYNSKNVTGISETLSGLTSATSYQYRVRYVFTNGVSANSNIITVITGAAGTTPPLAPIAISASGITLTSFVANWNAATGATDYQLDVSDDNFVTFLTGYNSKSISGTTEVISGLASNALFKFRVRAINAGGSSDNSNVINVTTLPGAPVATSPTGISATGFSANWNSVPGATGYQLDVSFNNFSTFLPGYNSKNVTALTETLSGLTSTTSYQYRVRYVYSNGVSGNSNVISVSTGAAGTTPPAAPVTTAATGVTLSSFVANWNAVTDATSYQLDVSEDNFTTFLTGYNSKNVSGTSETISGLSSNAIFKFRVRAMNAGGTSGNSNVISTTTLPVAPVAVSATNISATAFSANWNSVPGATGYQLDVSIDHFATFLTGYNSKSVTRLTETLSGLESTTSYQYRVRYVFANGVSGNSNVITAITGAIGTTPPATPVASSASGITLTSFAANWNAATGATDYQLDISEDNFATFLPGYNSKSISGTSELITGLTSNSTFKFRVRAMNAGGTSGNSNVISVTTLPVAPVAVSATNISAAGFSANWNSVPGATGYQLDVSSDNFNTFLSGYNSKNVTALTEALSGLISSTSYKYRVRYAYTNGVSGNSNVVTVATGVLGITPPTAPVATSGSGITLASFVASWDAVTGATNYQLDVSEDNFATFLPGYNSKNISGTSEVISGLTPNSTFKFRVRAVNAGGSSDNSNVVSVTTLPIAPVAVSATSISASGFSANWNSVPDATGYQLDVSSDNFATFLSGYNSKSVIEITEPLSGLTSGTDYQYRVRYVYANGVSGNSNVISVTTGAAGTTPPAAPVATSASTITLSSFVANWITVSEATSYQLDVSDDNFATFLPGLNSLSIDTHQSTIFDLIEGMTYYYRVRSVNAGGVSANSNTIIVTINSSLKTNQTIEFQPIADKTIGDPVFSLNAVATSGLTVTFSSPSSKVLVVGDQVTLVEAGMVSISASQLGNSSYNAAQEVTNSFCINPAKPTIHVVNGGLENYIIESSAATGNQWFKDGTLISGATGSTFNVTSNGAYSVEVTIEGCKSERSNELGVVITGDENFPLTRQLSISPNPTENILNLNFPSAGKREIAIYRITGHRVAYENSDQNYIQFDVSEYEPGIYLIRVSTNGAFYYGKFIKK